MNNIIDFNAFKIKSEESIKIVNGSKMTEEQFNRKMDEFNKMMLVLSNIGPKHWELMGKVSNIDSALYHVGQFVTYLENSIDELENDLGNGYNDVS